MSNRPIAQGPQRPTNKKSTGSRHGRDTRRIRPGLFALEDRTLLTQPPYSLQAALGAFNKVSQLASNAESIATQALGTQTVPLLADNLADFLGVSDLLSGPLGLQLSGSDWSDVVQEIDEMPGLSIYKNEAFTGTPYPGTNDLFALQYSQTDNSSPVQANLGSLSGFSSAISYFQNATGSLDPGQIFGSSQTATVVLTFGVDVPPGSTNPQFFLSPSASSVSFAGVNAMGGVSASGISIGGLGNVAVNNATLNLNLQAGMSFHANSSENDGKLRLSDFQSAQTMAGLVTGSFSGSVDLAASFSAQLPVLPEVDWSGDFNIKTSGNQWGGASVTLTPPDTGQFLEGIANSILGSDGIGSDFAVLGGLENVLNYNVPYIDESLADILGLHDLPEIPTIKDLTGYDASDVLALLSTLSNELNGLGIVTEVDGMDLAQSVPTVTDITNMVTNLIDGKPQDIISFTYGGTDQIFDESADPSPILSLGISDIGSIDLNFGYDVSGTLGYGLTLGVDTNGVYLAPGPTPPGQTPPQGQSAQGNMLSFTLSASATVSGDVEVAGVDLVSAGGTFTLNLTPYLSLSPDPYSPTPGRDYLKDLMAFGPNLGTDFLDALEVGASSSFGVQLSATVGLLFVHKTFTWSTTVPIFNLPIATPHWPPQPGASGAGQPNPPPWPVTQGSNGILVFEGTSKGDSLALSGGQNGSMTITWAGHASPDPGSNGPDSENFSNVRQFDYYGDGMRDQITTSQGFDIPIYATAVSNQAGGAVSNPVYFEGGDANDTLLGGAGPDTLNGGGGGDDSIQAGSGNDLLFGSSDGNNTLVGGSGNDTLVGGAGNDVIYAGSGLYYVNGGGGDDVIFGQAGHAAEMENGVMTYPVIHAGFTKNGPGTALIYGPTSPAEIFGDNGSDTIFGGTGADTISGGTGGPNLIYGGDGNDFITGGPLGNTIYGGLGDNTIYGGAGDNVLYGGNGDGTSTGSNLLIGGSGDNLVFGDSSGHNSLYGGAGNDTLYAGTGGDYLDGGMGDDVLIGGPGDDTLVEHFNPPGSTLPPPDRISGGPGFNTLLLMGDNNNDDIQLAPLDPATDTYSASMSNLDTGAPTGALTLTIPPDVEGLAIYAGTGNNLIQVSPAVLMNVTLLGGEGNDTLIGGSGNNLLIGGGGNNLLEGGSGDDVLYGGDQPSQDSQLQLQGGLANPGPVAPGDDTLIGGGGDDQLYGGPGNNVLIGGAAVMENGLWVPQSSPGHALLMGGAGNNLLIAGPGSLGDQIYGGGTSKSSNILVGDNGFNVMDGGDGDSLLLGGNLGNVMYSDFSDPTGGGSDTLVGGSGQNILYGDSAGNDLLYADNRLPQVASYWAQAEAAALADGVLLSQTASLVPNGPPIQDYAQLETQNATLAGQIEALLSVEQDPGLTSAEESELTSLLNVQTFVLEELIQVNELLGATVFPDSLIAGSGTDSLYGASIATSFQGGTGNDTFYYNSAVPIANDSWFGGTSGLETVMFEDPTEGDNISLNFEGDSTIQVKMGTQTYDWKEIVGIDAIGVTAVADNDDVTVDFGQAAPMQVFVQLDGGDNTIDASSLEAQATLLGGTGDDTIEIGTQLPAGNVYNGGMGDSTLDIQCSPLDQSDDITVNAGTLSIGRVIAKSQQTVEGVTLSGGSLSAADGVPESVKNFQNLEVTGGPGTNDFTTDGSIANVILQGGSGTNEMTATMTQPTETATLIGGDNATNILTATGGTSFLTGGLNATNTYTVNGGTSEITGGTGPNNYYLIGPGNYTVDGKPAIAPASPEASTPTGPTAPSGMTRTTSFFSQEREDAAATTVGNLAIFAGGEASTGPSNVVDIYNDSTGSWSSTTLSQSLLNMAATTVGNLAIFAGGDTSTGLSGAVYIYNAGTGKWSTTALPQPVQLMAATTVGNLAIFAGGVLSDGAHQQGSLHLQRQHGQLVHRRALAGTCQPGRHDRGHARHVCRRPFRHRK